MEKTATKSVAVLITVHNRKEKTLSCLRHLSNNIYGPLKLDCYLTDDGCTDGTVASVKLEFPEVRIVNGNGNLFWNRGMYKAWKEAAKSHYDFFLWLNDDTDLYADSLERLLDCSERHEDKALIVGSTCASDAPETVTYGGWTQGKLHNIDENDQICETVSGNIVLIPHYVFSILGFNDSYFHHSLGDTDYGLRAKEHGIISIVAPGLFGTCDLHGKKTKWMDPDYPFIERAKHMFSPTGNNPFEYFYFKKRHYGLLSACKSFITNFFHLFFPSLWR